MGQVFLDKMLGISKRNLAGTSEKKSKPVFLGKYQFIDVILDAT